VLLEVLLTIAALIAAGGLVVLIFLARALLSGRDGRYREKYQSFEEQRLRVQKNLERYRI